MFCPGSLKEEEEEEKVVVVACLKNPKGEKEEEVVVIVCFGGLTLGHLIGLKEVAHPGSKDHP